MKSVKKIFGPKKREYVIEEPPQLHHRSFGASLDFLYNRDGTTIPHVLHRLCCFLKEQGINKEGLFRVNGNVKIVKELKQAFDTNGDADLEDYNNISACASLLKLFLRELSDPVIPLIKQDVLTKLHELYCQDEEKLIPLVREVIKQLPKINREVLVYLFEFMLEISTKSEANKMTPTNLAVVFGPSLFRCGEGLIGAKDQAYANGILMVMLRKYDELFRYSEKKIVKPVLPPAYFQRGTTAWIEPDKAKINNMLIKQTIKVFGLEERLVQKEEKEMNMHSKRSSALRTYGIASREDTKEEKNPNLSLPQLRKKKLELQKFLLDYENKHGRPVSNEKKLNEASSYQQYREIKRLISTEEEEILKTKMSEYVH